MTVCNVYSCKEPLIIGRKSVFLLKTSLSSRICYITHTYIQHTRSNARSLYLHSLSTLEITSFYLLCETLANRSDYRSLNLASISLVKRLTSLQSNPRFSISYSFPTVSFILSSSLSARYAPLSIDLDNRHFCYNCANYGGK